MYYIRVKACLESQDKPKHSQLNNRLDAEYYSPDALKSEQKIVEYGNFQKFEQLIKSGYRVVYHGIDSVIGLYKNQTVPFLSPTDIDDSGAISFEAAGKVPSYYLDEYPKGLAETGELLIEVKGNVSKLAIIPESFPEGLLISGSLYKAKLKPDFDPWFVMSFLRSSPGQILKNRLTSNTIIKFIAKDELYSLPIALAHKTVQTYIGNKVRQAERLRERSRELENKVNSFHAQFIPSQSSLDFKKKTHRVLCKNLTERLDSHFYPSAVEKYLKSIDCRHVALGDLAQSIFNGQTQQQLESVEGTKQATVANLSSTFLKKPYRSVLAPTSSNRYFKNHDLSICNAAHEKSYIAILNDL